MGDTKQIIHISILSLNHFHFKLQIIDINP